MTETFALIPAAGRGVRFNNSESGRNKVFAAIGGQAMLRRTVVAFASHPRIDGVVIVAEPSEQNDIHIILSDIPKLLRIVPGGATRQESVHAGLGALGAMGASDQSIVLVHDAARPVLSAALIDRCIESARVFGSGVAAVPIVDTIRRLNPRDKTVEAIDRSDLWAMQTPQAFPYRTLTSAYEFATQHGIVATDDAALVDEFSGEPCRIVEGDLCNIKVTQRSDIILVEQLMNLDRTRSEFETRVGFGYDIHAFAKGRKLILGGVSIPTQDDRGLLGHSDADVLLHAICDALLGAAGLSDIGVYFPNTENKWLNADSTDLLRRVNTEITSLGYGIVNIDCTVIAEVPKISPFVLEMRRVISEALMIEASRIGLKATTHEGIGALGRNDGIAAHSVATISKKR